LTYNVVSQGTRQVFCDACQSTPDIRRPPVPGGEQYTVYTSSSTDAKGIRAEILTAACDKKAPPLQIVELFVFQWEKRPVQEFLFLGNN